MKIFLFLLSLIGGSVFVLLSAQSTHTVEVEVKGLRSSRGQLMVLVYYSSDEFIESPRREYPLPKRTLASQDNRFEIKDLPSGTYGILLIDDENMNAEIDMARTMATLYLIPTPVEGYGLANSKNALSRKPRFEDAALEVKKNIRIVIPIVYN